MKNKHLKQAEIRLLDGWTEEGYIEHVFKDLAKADAQIEKLQNVIEYALDIKSRQHGDDYPYDDCWQKMKETLEKIKGKK
jgi:hypothetical protein